MAHPAAPHIALENPFDDIHAIESTRDTSNPPPARVQGVGHGDTEVTGVRSRRCHSILHKIFTVFYPVHNSGSQHPTMAPVYSVCLLVGCFCVAISALGIYGSLVYIPIALFGAALFSSCITGWVLDYLTMPLCILSYVAVFVVTMMSYFLDQGNQPYQHTPLIIIMSVWCALIPVVCFLAWSFWRSRWGGIRRGNQQSRQSPPSQTAIELARLPREPQPAVLHPLQQHHAGLSVDHNPRKAPKIHSRWEQKYSHEASESFPPNGFHRTTKPSRVTKNECEQSIGPPDTQKSVGVDDHVSRFRGCHPSLSVSEDSRNVASDHRIGNAPSNDTHIRPRSRSGDTRTAGTGLPAHLQRPQGMKTTQEIGYLGPKTLCTSREVRSASSSAVDPSANSTFESPVFHLDRDGTKDVASRLQFRTIDKLETGRKHRKTSWVAQVKEELAAGFLPEQPPMLCEACAPSRPRTHELSGKKASVCSCRSVPEAQSLGTGRSESAVHEGQDQSPIQPSPLFRSSCHIRSSSEEGLFNHKPRVSNIKFDARVKHDPRASPEDGPSYSAMHQAVVLGSGPAILCGDKHIRSSAATKKSEPSTRTSDIGENKSSSRGEGFTPSEQLLKGNTKASMSNTSQVTDDKLQSSIRDNTLEEHSVNDQGRARSSATESGPIEMTWAQRVQAGESKGTIPRNPEQKLRGQDPLQNPSASGSLLPRSGFRWGLSKGSSVAPVSDSLHVSSPPANNRALPTVSSTPAQTSRRDGLRNSQSNGSLPRAVYQLTATFSSSHEQGQAASGSIRQTQTITRSSDKTARINPHDEGSDERLRKSSQPLARSTLDGMHAEEDDGSEWHIVTRKKRVPQAPRPSKSTRRKTKSLKRLSQSAPAPLVPLQNAASFLPTPKILPSLPPRSSFLPSSESMSTLLKPSYAAVASLRSPVISISSSTTSSADAPFISAPQSPEHPKPALDMLLESLESSDNYFSATEDLEEKCPSPTRELASEGRSDSWEAPAAIVLAETDKVLTTSAQASRDAYDKQILAAENIGPGSPNSTTIDITLGWMGQDQSIIRHRHSPEHSLQKSAAESLRVTDKPKGQARKVTKGVSSDPIGIDAPAGTSHERVRGTSSNAQENPTPSQGDGRVSDFGDSSACPMAAKKVPAEDTEGFRYNSEALSSPRKYSEDKSITFVREKESYPREVDTHFTGYALPALERSAGAPGPRASKHKTSKRGQKSKNAKHNSKPDASSRVTATPSPPRTADGQQVSPLSVLTSPPNILALSQDQDRNSASNPSQNSTQDLSSEPQRRGRTGGRVTHEVATGPNMPREGSILRGEAPEFTPQTTPSKSRGSTLQSPASLDSHMREGTVQPLDLDYAAFALGSTPAPLQSLSGARDKFEESILMPWMSRDFWLPRNTVAMGHEMQCALVGKNMQSEPREQTATTPDLPGPFGQIRRLKPCGFVKVEQAVEQIGTWCPRCDPDY